MATYARAFGRDWIPSTGAVPADAVAAAITGNRVHMSKGRSVAFLVIASAGSTDILDVDLQEHTAATGGTSQDLDIVTDYWYSSEATLDGDETFTKVTQAAASEITDVGTASTQQLLVIEVAAEQLSAGFHWLSLNVPDLGSNGTKYVAVVNLLCNPHAQRAPELHTNLNT
jgi:hypothetical protein